MNRSILLKILTLFLFLIVIAACIRCGGSKGSQSAPVNSVPNSAILTWNAPETNGDGTPLTDLAGYKIYYGKSPGNYSEAIVLPLESASCQKNGNMTTCNFTITGFSSGRYYFALTAYNSDGFESSLSNEASKEF